MSIYIAHYRTVPVMRSCAECCWNKCVYNRRPKLAKCRCQNSRFAVMFTSVTEAWFWDQNMHSTVCPECFISLVKYHLLICDLKPRKTKHLFARIDVLAFRSTFHHCGTVWYFGVCKCLNIAECFASVLLSAVGLATEQVISTEKRVLNWRGSSVSE